MNLYIIRQIIRPTFVIKVSRLSTATDSIVDLNEQSIVDEDNFVREAEIESKRNKSRLSQAHYSLINGRRPFSHPMCLAHKTVKYSRKMFGKYGIASGVNPSLCWPTKEDIVESKEYEAIAYPFTIQQMVLQVTEKRDLEKLKMQQREDDIASKMEKLEQWKKELNDRITKKTAEASAAKEKKERLVEEVRRHFGFKLDPRDERFQEMLVKREKEQKKLEKIAKKEAKEKLTIAKLQQKNAEMSEKTV